MKPEEVLTAYMSAFETLNPDAVVPFYHAPCIFITPFGVAAVSDATSARAIASRFIEHARSQDYKRTELAGRLEVRRLAANLASIAGVFRRIDSKDQEIMQFGFTYTLRDSGEGWKIAVIAVHDVLSPSA